MESTAQHWRPVWNTLERYWRAQCRGAEGAGPMSGSLLLALAQSNRGPRGRKRDFVDAERLLKRLVAAPVRKSHLLGAQLTSRLIFLVPEAGALLLFARFALGVPFRGSLFLLAAISLLGALAFSGLGLLVAARPRTIEGVSGLMNLAMVPMWIFSGIFFSTERFPATIQPFVQALPLTALNDALRGVMLQGTGLGPLLPEFAVLAVWGTIGFLLALKFFRWQ